MSNDQDLPLRLESWAQNEEMVDSNFTDHGLDCIEAAKAIQAMGSLLQEALQQLPARGNLRRRIIQTLPEVQ